jgi:hypothetical protein
MDALRDKLYHVLAAVYFMTKTAPDTTCPSCGMIGTGDIYPRPASDKQKIIKCIKCKEIVPVKLDYRPTVDIRLQSDSLNEMNRLKVHLFDHTKDVRTGEMVQSLA